MTDPQADALATPAPASHDRSVPTGLLEESAATLFEAALDARDAAAGELAPLLTFYRALLTATLLLPVPPGSQQEARRSLASAVSDQEEVEIGVLLARDGEGNPVSVVFGSGAALAAWSPTGSGNIALPARVVMQNLAASGLPAILDPAGPVPYRFEPAELAALAAGRFPGTHERVFPEEGGTSVRLRLPGPEADAVERAARQTLARTAVRAAYLVESTGRDGRRLVLGLVGEDGAAAEMREIHAAAAAQGAPLEIVTLDERARAEFDRLAPPFYRAGRPRAR